MGRLWLRSSSANCLARRSASGPLKMTGVAAAIAVAVDLLCPPLRRPRVGVVKQVDFAHPGLATLRTPEGNAIPPNTLAELQREMALLRFVNGQIKQIEAARQEQLEQAPQEGSNAKVLQLERIRGVGVETADMLVHEVFSRDFRHQRAVARYAGLTGSPDESGRRRREKGLAKAGNARVRRGMIQLGWRFLIHQKDSGLAQEYSPASMAVRSRPPWSWHWLASCSSLFGDLSRLAMYPGRCSPFSAIIC